MLSNIGNIFLFLSILLGITIIFFSIKNLRTNNDLIKKNIYQLCLFQSTIIIICFFTLIAAFIVSDFSVSSVYHNSHSFKPLLYKISGAWGNHEGSLLLWAIILTVFSFLFLLFNKSHPKNYRLYSLVIQNILILGFLFFILFNSNPFSVILPTPKEGLGLNPILQDPALAIHPPILYLGYVGSSIIFSSVLAATTLNYISKNWATHIKSWVLASWIFLTLGIMLGSIWAYYELGWGGFWFWDPVENVSLMPWLVLTTLLHCILILEKRSILSSWVIILSITTFTLSMCGTFLVRSGILNSIHTFANDPERGLFILTFLFILILISLFIFLVFHKSDNQNSSSFFFFSKETSILINNWFMMYFLSVVLIGTVYPIFLDVITSQKISIGPPFYHKLIIPFLIPFLIFMAIGPQLKWIKSGLEGKVYLAVIFIISLLISFFIVKNTNTNFLVNTILIGSAFFLFFTTIRDFFLKKLKGIQQNIAHFGFSLLILSILFNNIFSSELIANLKVGESTKNDRFEIIFNKLEKFEEKNYILFKGNFSIIENEIEDRLEPELRIYNQPNIITSEADIKTSLLTDKFITMNIVHNEEYFNIRYQVKPFMIWIWISILLISLGGLISLFKKKYEK